MEYICVKWTNNGPGIWLVAFSAPSHYLNQCCLSANELLYTLLRCAGMCPVLAISVYLHRIIFSSVTKEDIWLAMFIFNYVFTDDISCEVSSFFTIFEYGFLRDLGEYHFEKCGTPLYACKWKICTFIFQFGVEEHYFTKRIPICVHVTPFFAKP